MFRVKRRTKNTTAWLVPLMIVALGAAGCGDDSTAGDPCASEDCSGHGNCEVVDNAAVCTCDTGYDGSECGDCTTGYVQDANGVCVEAESCVTDDPCGEHGTCDDSTGSIICDCDDGYTGDYCNQCYPGYHDDGTGACILDIDCRPNSCAGHGTCDDSTGLVTCTCDAGYTDDNCADCATGYHRDANDNCVVNEDCTANDPCGVNGTCDDTSGVIECVCDDGYDGTFCDQCYPGYHDDGSGVCVLDETCLPNACDGHGTCDATGGVVDCTCNAGYVGDSCDTCDASHHEVGPDCVADEYCYVNDPCVNGTCVDTTGVVECACDIGYDGTVCDQCAAGYHDDGSSTNTCVLDEQCLPNTCSGHGTCTATNGVVSCACDTGYTGAWCGSCDVGSHRDAANDCVIDEDCGVTDPCGTHGTCDDSTGVIECVCDTGYASTVCDACYPGYESNMISGLCEVPCFDPFQFRCNGTCTYAGDINNCGACGNDCSAAGLQCLQNGMNFTCGCPDFGTWETCGTTCHDLANDPNHCGGCAGAGGTVCDTAAGEICFGGNCVTPDTNCLGGCWPSSLCCAGNCWQDWDLMFNDMMCGDCTTQCTPGVEICVLGTCEAGDGSCGGACGPMGLVCCQSNCMDPFMFMFDDLNCGSCGNACGSNAHCDTSLCRCNQGTEDCGAGCIDIWADEANCGGCGNACNAGEVCVYGSCEPDNSAGCGGTCGADEYCCAGPPEECVAITDMDMDPNHCGSCDPCAPGEDCMSGTCGCNYFPGGYCSGTCTDFASTSNCGGCGVQCAQGEECWDWNMPMVYECICTGELCGGVCTNTMYNEANCGGCAGDGGVACGANEACVQGQCVPETGSTCAPWCADQGACCDDGGFDQCYDWWTLQNNINHCGGCGIQCTGDDICVNGICAPPPGPNCNNAEPAQIYGFQANLCGYTASGFTSGLCGPPADGTQVDRFYSFIPPYPAPGGQWVIDFMPLGLGTPAGEVWVNPGDPCDNMMPVGCLTPWGQFWIDETAYPPGTEFIIIIYDYDPCMMGGDFDLFIWDA